MSPNPYTSDRALRRLILLISAIAQHPGIGNPDVGVSPMVQILEKMRAIDPSCPDWSEATLRKDIRFLIERGILPRVPNAKKNRGYRIGVEEKEPAPVLRKRSCGQRQAKLSDEEILKLRNERKLSYQQLADLAGVSKSRIGQIVNDDLRAAGVSRQSVGKILKGDYEIKH